MRNHIRTVHSLAILTVAAALAAAGCVNSEVNSDERAKPAAISAARTPPSNGDQILSRRASAAPPVEVVYGTRGVEPAAVVPPARPGAPEVLYLRRPGTTSASVTVLPPVVTARPRRAREAGGPPVRGSVRTAAGAGGSVFITNVP